MDKASAIARSRRNIIVSPRRRRAGGSHRSIAQPSRLRRIARAVWGSPWHIALALVLGLLSGAAPGRVDPSTIPPPFPPSPGTLRLYPLAPFLWPGFGRRR